jgi:hypothetical protein
MEFYAKRTVSEQAKRLPPEYQASYRNSQLDRIVIDGCELHGYFEYSFMDEKTYKEQPVRSNDGTIVDLEDYSTFLTPRLIIKYNMMGIDDYRNLMTLLKAKNAHIVTCYDEVADKRVTHEMYFAPPQMPIIYQRYLSVLGIQDQSIELIGTNRKLGSIMVFWIGETNYKAFQGENWLSFTISSDSGYKVEYSSLIKRFVVSNDGGRNAVISSLTEDYVSPYDTIEVDWGYYVQEVSAR